MSDSLDKSYFCEKCKKTISGANFYTSNNLEKYPNDGKLNLCKRCLTMHVDIWNPDTYLWILQELDVPYVPKEWNDTLAKWAKDKTKVTGMSILGRYLSKMKLKQYKDYRWADTEFVNNLINEKIEATMKKSGYSPAEIAQTIQKGTYDIAEVRPPDTQNEPQEAINQPAPNTMSTFGQQIEDELVSDLTDEDRRYLCITWGKNYRPDEWIYLEQLYQNMMSSYDIQQAGDENTLKLACKSSLKANQLLDIGDIEGAQKAAKIYDSLMKSGKWTAAQNKTESNDFVDSIGELVALCERDGFIPKYYTDGPKDHADRIIEDLQKYTHDLITNETGLTSMMETAVKQIEEEQERIAAAAKSSIDSDEEDKLFDYDDNRILTDEDFSNFKDFENELLATDAEAYEKMLEEEY